MKRLKRWLVWLLVLTVIGAIALSVMQLVGERRAAAQAALRLAGGFRPGPGRGGGNQVNVAECTDRTQPGRSLLGAAQEQWLEQALAASPARWNIIAQTTLMAQADRGPDDTRRVYTDGWDGYPLAREKLLNPPGRDP